MNEVVAIQKRLGETPLEALTRLRAEKNEYKDETLSYAGRLDPMASGVMLVLVGDANKEREKYLGLDKTYRAEILFGVSTDTFDTLGIIEKVSEQNVSLEEKTVADVVGSLLGTFTQKYPSFSSKPVDGIPLFAHARAGKRVAVPSHDVTLYESELIQLYPLQAKDILKRIREQVALVQGDFRQGNIVASWEEKLALLPGAQQVTFLVAEIELKVSSGFYVRQYAQDMGELLGVPACAFSIDRTQVGVWSLDDCII